MNRNAAEIIRHLQARIARLEGRTASVSAVSEEAAEIIGKLALAEKVEEALLSRGFPVSYLRGAKVKGSRITSLDEASVRIEFANGETADIIYSSEKNKFRVS